MYAEKAFEKIQHSLSFTFLKNLKQKYTSSRKSLLYYIEWIQIVPATFRNGKAVISSNLHIGNSWYLVTICFVSGTLLSPFILTMLWTRYCDYFHFTDEETGAYRSLVTFPAFHGYEWAGIWIQISLSWHFKLLASSILPPLSFQMLMLRFNYKLSY